MPASHFYRRMGCTLGGINRFAYPDRPHEAQLLWFLARENGVSISPATKTGAPKP